MLHTARRVAPAALALLALAGSTLPVRADDDDKKLRDKKPAVVAPIFRNSPDPWKVLSRIPSGGAADDVFPMNNMVLKAWLPLNVFPGYPGTSASGADCWGYTSPGGREYALMGLSWGNGIVDVTNPLAPVIVTVIPGGVNSLWRDITVVGH